MTGNFPAPIFSLQNQRDAIEGALLHLPEGDKGAFVAVATLQGVQVAVTAKFGEHWRVVGVLEKPYDGEMTAEAKLLFSW